MYRQQTLQGIERLEGIIDQVIEGFEAATIIDNTGAGSEGKIRLVLEERIDIAFREAVNAAIDHQRNVVASLTQRIESVHRMINWGSVALAVMASAVIMIGVFWLIRSIMTPVDALKRSAGAIAGGDFNFRAPLGFDAEFDEISTGFNQIADRLSGLDKAREQTQKELEYQVDQRTAELTAANTAL